MRRTERLSTEKKMARISAETTCAPVLQRQRRSSMQSLGELWDFGRRAMECQDKERRAAERPLRPLSAFPLGLLLVQPLLDGGDDGLKRLHAGVPLVVGFDDGPGRVRRGGVLEHVLDRLGVLVPLGAVAPVLLGELVGA